MNSFAQPQVTLQNVRYCHNVAAINSVGEGRATSYELTLTVTSPCNADTAWDGINNVGAGSETTKHTCDVLLMADGMWKPTNPNLGAVPFIKGLDLTTEYGDLAKIDVTEFEARRVMILGCGNVCAVPSTA